MLMIFRGERGGRSPYDEAMEAIQKQKTMKITRNNAVVGAKVKLVTRNWGDHQTNPVWGGAYGQIQGEITGFDNYWIRVKWSNGCTNSYYDDDLEQIQVPAIKDETPVATVTVTLTKSTPTVTLEKAIRNIIEAYESDSKDFSAYDITKAVRKQVNDKVIELHGVAFEDVSGVQTQRIEHMHVRPIVRSVMDGKSNYSRLNSNDGYVLYKFTTATKPAVVYTPTGVSSTPASTPVAATSTASTNPVVDVEKLKVYIQGGSSTLKQIQSRFKVRGAKQPTVREIAQVVNATAGLMLEERKPFHSSLVF